MTHGEKDFLYSRDQCYKLDRIWKPFTAEKCPTLAGKPKIFIFQACQGSQVDSGLRVRMRRTTETDAATEDQMYKIPTHVDFLMAYR